MKVNKWLAIGLIALICVALAVFIGSTAFRTSRKGVAEFARKSDTVVFDESFEGISNISVKQDAGEIRFEHGEQFRVVVYGEKKNSVNVSAKVGNLSIENRRKGEIPFFGVNIPQHDVVVYVPNGFGGNITIDNDYGNCIVSDLENAEVDIKCDEGYVEVGKIKNAVVKCDLGDVTIGEVLNRCNIKADLGNVRVERIDIKENSEIKADVGNVSIKSVNNVKIDADVDVGKAKINGGNSGSAVVLKIKCDVGNVEVG